MKTFLLVFFLLTRYQLTFAMLSDPDCDSSLLSGVTVTKTEFCQKARASLAGILEYQRFDPFLLDPDGDHPLPDLSRFSSTHHSDLMCFYSDKKDERDSSFLRLYTSFLDVIRNICASSYEFETFKVLLYTADNVWARFQREDLERFKIIFNEKQQLEALDPIIEALGAFLKAKKEDKKSRKDELNLLLDAFQGNKVMAWAYDPYTQSLKETYEEILSKLSDSVNPSNFEGRLALTRILISYGETIKSLPNPKSSSVKVECVKLRDKVIKVLPRRLEMLKEEGMKVFYAPIDKNFLMDLHKYIFEKTAAPDEKHIKNLRKKWEEGTKKPQMDGPALSVKTDTGDKKDVLLSFLKEMRKLTGLHQIKLPALVFLEENGTFFSNLITNLKSNKNWESPKYESAFHTFQYETFPEKLSAMKNWQEPKEMEVMLQEANRLVSDHLPSILPYIEESDFKKFLDYNSLKYERPRHLRFLIKLMNVRQGSVFDQAFPMEYNYVTEKIKKFSTEKRESLRVLAYGFLETATDKEDPIDFSDADKIKLGILRNYFAHFGIGDFSWDKVLSSSIPLGRKDQIQNELHAICFLMIGFQDMLER